MHETATREAIDTSRQTYLIGNAARAGDLQGAVTVAMSIGASIRQVFRGIVHGVWTCPHDKLEFDEIGDICCKRCNKNLMD